jgi:hypothetical protein
MPQRTKDLMGKVVVVEKVYRRIDLEPARNGHVSTTKMGWEVIDAVLRPGWVVGERWLQAGTAYHGDYDDPASWTRGDVSYHCLLVAYWPSMKPVRVPVDGFKLADGVAPYRTPGWPYTERHRKEMRKEMADWPRDVKGRWVKKEQK